MLVVDGKQAPTSEGCDMYELAEILKDAGCYNAVNMDGGGSTTMVARPEGKENYEVISSPCDGAPRAVASSFYIVSRVPSSDEAHHAAVEADADYITPEGTVNITASALNYAGTAVEIARFRSPVCGEGHGAQTLRPRDRHHRRPRPKG